MNNSLPQSLATLATCISCTQERTYRHAKEHS
nr:MAG TPA: hypothetical protein [Caudoviricetes sp.]